MRVIGHNSTPLGSQIRGSCKYSDKLSKGYRLKGPRFVYDRQCHFKRRFT
jgi:hypothetical protein